MYAFHSVELLSAPSPDFAGKGLQHLENAGAFVQLFTLAKIPIGIQASSLILLPILTLQRVLTLQRGFDFRSVQDSVSEFFEPQQTPLATGFIPDKTMFDRNFRAETIAEAPHESGRFPLLDRANTEVSL
jgi:hypothetical protein